MVLFPNINCSEVRLKSYETSIIQTVLGSLLKKRNTFVGADKFFSSRKKMKYYLCPWVF